MKVKTILLILISIIGLSLCGIYLYSSWKIRSTQNRIADTMYQMKELKSSLQDQKEEITKNHLPKMKAFLAQKDKKESLLAGLGLLQFAKNFIPIVEDMPLPRMRQELKSAFNSLFDTLDTLLEDTVADLEKVLVTIDKTVPQVDMVITLHKQALDQLETVSTLSTIQRALGW